MKVLKNDEALPSEIDSRAFCGPAIESLGTGTGGGSASGLARARVG